MKNSDDNNDLAAGVPDDYEALLTDLRGIIEAGRGQAAAAVNAALVQTYWRLGQRIVEAEQGGSARARYGELLLTRLGRALALEFGRGFSERSLREMRQFYQAYKKWREVRAELSWTHYHILMRLEPEIRDFYERLAVSNRWSSTQLQSEISRKLHERVIMPGTPEELIATLPEPRPAALTYEEAFRDPYILDFLGLHGAYTEKDLEVALVANMERFLLELGAGFMFMARQQPITVGSKDFYIDLVLYHRWMRCVVLIELKIGEFEPAAVGQMKLYLEWFKRHDKGPNEADPIGLILCGSRDEQVVEYLLPNPDDRIKVSQFLSTSDQQAIREHLARMAIARERLADNNADNETQEAEQ